MEGGTLNLCIKKTTHYRYLDQAWFSQDNDALVKSWEGASATYNKSFLKLFDWSDREVSICWLHHQRVINDFFNLCCEE